jgi:hypothetical protein
MPYTKQNTNLGWLRKDLYSYLQVGKKSKFEQITQQGASWFVDHQFHECDKRGWPWQVIFFYCAKAPIGLGPPHYRVFTITLRHTKFFRTPLDEWSARSTDLYLTTQNTHKRQTSMPPAGFDPTIPVSEQPQTQALDREATGIGVTCIL